MSSVFGCGKLEVPFTIRGAMEGRRVEEGGGGGRGEGDWQTGDKQGAT